MDHIGPTLDELRDWIPAGVGTLVFVLLLMAMRWFANRPAGPGSDPSRRFLRQVFVIGLWAIGLITIVLLLPFTVETRGQIMGLVGALLGAAIALSSTTVLGNLMAGLMLRAVGNFRPGDFIETADFVGRVTVIGWVHTEIQDEESDLVTFPNLYLVQKPYRVVRSHSTLISAEVSLGYDVPQEKAKEALVKATEACGLKEGFAWVGALGDFSITYRTFGLLENPKRLLSSRARLRSAMIDSLHEAGIEIVSPTFMNQRQISTHHPIIPRKYRAATLGNEANADALMFDKAAEAASLERLREIYSEVDAQLREAIERADRREADGAAEEAAELQKRCDHLTSRKKRIRDLIVEREAAAKSR